MAKQPTPGAAVSVIIPVYNRVDRVCLTIESVLAQEDVRAEVIVVDDGSTDGSFDAVSEIAREVPRVRVEGFGENRGVSAARNRGMEIATSEFLTFIDSDDRMPPRRLAEQLDALAEEHDGLVVGLQELDIADEIDLPVTIAATLDVDPSDRFYIMSMFGRRSTFDRVGWFLEEFPISQDLDYLIRARDMGVPVVRVPRIWVLRGIYGDNLVNDDVALRRELLQVYRAHHRRVGDLASDEQ